MICQQCGGATHLSSLTGRRVHDNDADWVSKAAGGDHPVRVDHRPTPESPVRQHHPGGKDGMYRAYCVCGYVTGFDSMSHANASLQQHITDKDWSPTP